MDTTDQHLENRSSLEAEIDRLQQELSQNRQQFQAAFLNMPFGFVWLKLVWDKANGHADGEIIFANESFQRLINLHPDQLSGKRMTDLWPELSDRFSALFNQVTGTGLAAEQELQVQAAGKYFNLTGYQIQQGQIALTFCDITDKKREEDQLQLQKEFYEKVLETVHEGIWVADKDDIIFFANRGLTEITGAPKEHILRKNVLTGFRPETTREFREPFLQAKSSLQTLPYEVKLKNLAGRDAVHAGWLIPMVKNDLYDGMICSILDVTEQRKTRELIKENEQRLRNIIEHSTNAFYSHTPDHVLTYVSPQIKRILGYEPQEAPMRWMEQLTDHPINRIGFELCNKAIETGVAQEPYELELIHRNGSKVRVEVRETPVVENGKTTAIVGSLTDITRHTEVSRELTESRQGMLNLIDRSPVPIAINSLDGKIEYLNGEFINTFGYTLKDIPTLDHWWPLAYPNKIYRESLKKEWLEKIKNDRHNPDYPGAEVAITCKDGSTKFIQIMWSRVVNKLVLIFNDLTRHKMLEDQIIRKNKELEKAKMKAEESDALKSAFLANMSHEIRTPMNSIIGFSSLLAEDEVTEDKRKKYISFIQLSGEHLLRLIDDIIDVAKIESNQLKLQKSHVELRPLLESIYEHHLQSKLLAQKPNLAFGLDMKNLELMEQIYTDPVRLKQVFDNLITNAIKNTYEGRVDFGVHQITKSKITFYVSDTGIGIPPRFQETIFNRFLQIESKIPKQGTGLGLSIIKGILTLLHGRVWFDSEENKGSCFYFCLPVNG
ncbi:PAS domain-containing sensor histidine kinase [Gaoshiqia sediminis]|uniref:histidine kinase n=1 Tax=Gaoshiqia sediminis TaxID=2986998 RepID=A0AA41YCI8_9BACT|nr:PAS domain S-box protein [Gaoshiqia sediminis]MCW0483850.1 PAS domain S-box protein [Gaoshiqia sediminis]